MKDLLLVSLCALLIIVYSEAVEDLQIRASIVYIKCNSTRIQTGVYNKKLRMIFTLDTIHIRGISSSYPNQATRQDRLDMRVCSELKAYNGLYEDVQINKMNLESDNVLQLGLHGIYELNIEKPLLFGPEDYDAQAQIAGWTKDNVFILTPLICIEQANYGLIQVHYNNAFMTRCTVDGHPHDIKLGDVLIQENKVIGFLKEIYLNYEFLVFLPALRALQQNGHGPGVIDGEIERVHSSTETSSVSSSSDSSPPSSPSFNMNQFHQVPSSSRQQ